MPNYEQLTLDQHAELKVDPLLYVSVARSFRSCAIVKSEAFSAAGSFPLFALKNEASGQLVLSALFSLISEKNLFCHESRWGAPYTPVNVKRYPFGVSMSEDGTSPGNILIDADLVPASADAGRAIFDKNGVPTPFFQSFQKSLGLLASEQRPTIATIDRLIDEELLIGMEIKLEFSQSTQSIGQLYGVNPTKFSTLSSHQFERLSTSGDLETLLAMRASLSQISRLVWMENQNLDDKILSFSLAPSK